MDSARFARRRTRTSPRFTSAPFGCKEVVGQVHGERNATCVAKSAGVGDYQSRRVDMDIFRPVIPHYRRGPPFGHTIAGRYNVPELRNCNDAACLPDSTFPQHGSTEVLLVPRCDDMPLLDLLREP